MDTVWQKKTLPFAISVDSTCVTFVEEKKQMNGVDVAR